MGAFQSAKEENLNGRYESFMSSYWIYENRQEKKHGNKNLTEIKGTVDEIIGGEIAEDTMGHQKNY